MTSRAERQPLVEVDRATVNYRKGSAASRVFDGLDLRIDAGSWLCITGPSGSGKTTLLNLIAGLQRPDSGTVRYDGHDLGRLSGTELLRWRRSTLGFVFQFHHLFDALSVAENVAVPLLLADSGRELRAERVTAALELVDMQEHRLRRPDELSGGQQQLVSVARAIVANPPLLLADEPTGNLDRESGDRLMQVLALLNREFGKTVVMVTHDPDIAALASRNIHLNKGRMAQRAQL